MAGPVPLAVHAGWSRVPELWTLDRKMYQLDIQKCQASVSIK
jgi:hypothetical protein